MPWRRRARAWSWRPRSRANWKNASRPRFARQCEACVVTIDLGFGRFHQGSLCRRRAKSSGRIDILVNNAAITKDGLALRMKKDDWDAVLATNLTGAFLAIQQVLQGMMKERWGRIINISSIVGETGNPGQANYVASKAGLIGLTKSLAQEMASRNITVNAVAPGFIETDMTAVLSRGAEREHAGAHSAEAFRQARKTSRPRCGSWRAKKRATSPDTC